MRWITWMSGIRLALDSIRESKLRAFLTVLGVIIGTGTIIGVGSIIAGLGWRDHRDPPKLRSEHTDRVQVPRRIRDWPNLTPEEWKRKPLTLENALAIAGALPVGASTPAPYLLPGMEPYPEPGPLQGQ